MIIITSFSRYLRPKGYFLALFISLYFLINKRYKIAVIFIILFSFLCSLWIIRNIIAYNKATQIQKDYLLVGTRQASVILQKGPFQKELITPKGLFIRFLNGFNIYFSNIIPNQVLGMKFFSNRLTFGIIFFLITLLGYIFFFE